MKKLVKTGFDIDKYIDPNEISAISIFLPLVSYVISNVIVVGNFIVCIFKKFQKFYKNRYT